MSYCQNCFPFQNNGTIFPEKNCIIFISTCCGTCQNRTCCLMFSINNNNYLNQTLCSNNIDYFTTTRQSGVLKTTIRSSSKYNYSAYFMKIFKHYN